MIFAQYCKSSAIDHYWITWNFLFTHERCGTKPQVISQFISRDDGENVLAKLSPSRILNIRRDAFLIYSADECSLLVVCSSCNPWQKLPASIPSISVKCHPPARLMEVFLAQVVEGSRPTRINGKQTCTWGVIKTARSNRAHKSRSPSRALN